MDQPDIEMSDVVIVLDELDDAQTLEVVEKLKGSGMRVDSVDNDNSVIEGSIESLKVHEVKKLDHVRYVRPVFSYRAEFPSGAGDEDSED